MQAHSHGVLFHGEATSSHVTEAEFHTHAAVCCAAGAAWSDEGVLSNKTPMLLHAKEAALNEPEVASNAEGVSFNEQGVALNAQGVAATCFTAP